MFKIILKSLGASLLGVGVLGFMFGAGAISNDSQNFWVVLLIILLISPYVALIYVYKATNK